VDRGDDRAGSNGLAEGAGLNRHEGMAAGPRGRHGSTVSPPLPESLEASSAGAHLERLRAVAAPAG